MADEILVHISTPATRQNDELYRSLASAYVEFRPCATYRDNSVQELSARNEPGDTTLNRTATPAASGTYASVDTSISSAGRDSYGSFPSNLSFGGHVEGQTSLDLRSCHASPEDDFMPGMSRLARLDHSLLNWREKTTPKADAARARKRVRQMSCESDEADTAFIEDSQLAAQVLQSQLQDGYSTTSEDTEDEEVERVADTPSEEVGKVEETKVLSFDRISSSQWDAEQNMHELQSSVCPSPPANEVGSVGENLENDEDFPAHSTLDFSFLQHGDNDDESIRAIHVAASSVDFTELPVDAFAPAPPISTSKPSTLPSQITISLSTLKTQNPARFQPLKQRRTPKHDERGHWAINSAQWPQQLQHEFWSSLYEHVCSGRIGWGTTLHRDAESPEVLGWVKLYCWGEVVEHMWLLLWLCSKGEVSGSRTRWVDANGVAVFQMQ
jgi:hypothetical protein